MDNCKTAFAHSVYCYFGGEKWNKNKLKNFEQNLYIHIPLPTLPLQYAIYVIDFI